MTRQQRVLAALAAGPMTSHQVEMAARVGLGRARVVLNELRRAGLVERQIIDGGYTHQAVWRLAKAKGGER